MVNHKSDVITESQFTKMSTPKSKKHFQVPSDLILDDENYNVVDETLMGMEYDLESNEEINDVFDSEEDEKDI
jgi:hypothetical protein